MVVVSEFSLKKVPQRLFWSKRLRAVSGCAREQETSRGQEDKALRGKARGAAHRHGCKAGTFATSVSNARAQERERLELSKGLWD